MKKLRKESLPTLPKVGELKMLIVEIDGESLASIDESGEIEYAKGLDGNAVFERLRDKLASTLSNDFQEIREKEKQGIPTPANAYGIYLKLDDTRQIRAV